MSNQIGQLLVELGINVANFTDGCDRATYKSKQAAKDIGRAFEGMGQNIAGILGNIGGEFGGVFGEILAGTGATVSKIATQMGSIKSIPGAVAIGVSALGAAAVTTTAAIIALSVKSAEATAATYRLAQSTGIAFESFQKLAIASKVAGVDVEVLASRINVNFAGFWSGRWESNPTPK